MQFDFVLQEACMAATLSVFLTQRSSLGWEGSITRPMCAEAGIQVRGGCCPASEASGCRVRLG